MPEPTSTPPTTSDANSQTVEAKPGPEVEQGLIRLREMLAEIGGLISTATAGHARAEADREHIAEAKAEIDVLLEQLHTRSESATKLLADASKLIEEMGPVSAALAASQQKTVETQAQSSSLLESLRASERSVAEIAARTEALKAQIEQSAQVAEKRSAHIEDGRKHADEVRQSLDAALTAAQLSATTATGMQQSVESTLETVTQVSAEIKTARAQADADSKAIVSSKRDAEAALGELNKLADAADSVDARVSAYQQKLQELTNQAEERLKQIETLLPGATGAGLASAFHARSQTFKAPEKNWNRAFMASIVGLLLLAGYEAWSATIPAQTPDYQQLLRMLLHRLPFLIPLVWLAIHSARQAALNKRMEEEYAFKAACATSFEGFRREMAAVGAELPASSALSQLCRDTLKTIGTPPGRVYDRHRMDPTPVSAVAESAKPIAEVAARITQG